MSTVLNTVVSICVLPRAVHALLVASVFARAKCPASRVSRDCLGADQVDNHSGYSLIQEFLLSVTLKRYCQALHFFGGGGGPA